MLRLPSVSYQVLEVGHRVAFDRGGDRVAGAHILAPSLYLYPRTIRLHGHDLLVDDVASLSR